MNVKHSKIFFLVMAAGLLVSVLARASQMDDRIESTIKNTYVFKVYLKGDSVKIRSNDGVVTLEGIVKKFPHILLAQQVAASIPGVKSIDNRLEYYGGFPKINSDTWISEQLTDSFHDYTSLDNRIRVLVHNGIVTLRGLAYSQAEEDTACEYASDVGGVIGVKNEMTMAKNSLPSLHLLCQYVDDTSLSAEIQSAFYYHHSMSGFKPRVTVINGVVTLSGQASSTAVKNMAAKVAGNVTCVKRVINDMLVRRSE